MASYVELNNDAVRLASGHNGDPSHYVLELKVATLQAAHCLEALRPNVLSLVQSINISCLPRPEGRDRLVISQHDWTSNYRDTSFDLILSYDKFLRLARSPSPTWIRSEESTIAAVMLYNIGHAAHRRAQLGTLNRAVAFEEALRYYQLSVAACNITLMEEGDFTTIVLASLTNMAQIYGILWRPLELHQCLRALHETIKDPYRFSSMDQKDASFFCSNLTCACALQWKNAPVA